MGVPHYDYSIMYRPNPIPILRPPHYPALTQKQGAKPEAAERPPLLVESDSLMLQLLGEQRTVGGGAVRGTLNSKT